MYKYNVVVTGSHLLGHDFLRDYAFLIKDGAVLNDNGNFAHNTSYPPRAYLTLESDTVKQNTASTKYYLIAGGFTREELDEMKWEDLKTVCKEVGITGRDRELITTAYLEHVNK